MTSDQISSGDETLNDTSPPVEDNPPNPVDKGGEGDKVAYESYQKLLSEKKRLQAKLDKQERESESRQKEELESQARYKELYDAEKAESETLRGTVQGFEERWDDALKLDSFNRALGDTRKIDPKYSGFIDTSNILIDPETRKIDELSAKREVDRVLNAFPEIVKSTVTSHLPNETPTAGSSGLTKAQWMLLGSSKEMIARRGEVTDWKDS